LQPHRRELFRRRLALGSSGFYGLLRDLNEARYPRPLRRKASVKAPGDLAAEL